MEGAAGAGKSTEIHRKLLFGSTPQFTELPATVASDLYPKVSSLHKCFGSHRRPRVWALLTLEHTAA